MLKALIIDDEPLAHDVILHHLANHGDFKKVGQCYSATEALSWLANNQVDLIFLDINMPELNGIELLTILRNRPQIIIVSAYQDYAIQGFEFNVTDYLLKPVCAERFSQALEKVRERAVTKSTVAVNNSIVLKVDREKRKFKLSDIALLEAYGNYVKLSYKDEVVLVSSSLKLLLELLPSNQFVQVHKSFVINNEHVSKVDANTVTLQCGKVIRISKFYKVNSNKLL